MKCAKPVLINGQAVGCSQCLPCRLNKRRSWTHRIILERTQHGDAAFVTLTYADEFLPADGSLSPEHLRNWLKRFRKAISPHKIRFYGVGEYGEQSFRPHYHVAIFGWPACPFVLQRQLDQKECDCEACRPVRETWGMGRIYSGTLEMHSAQYIAGYVTKKMSSRFDERLLRNDVWLHPEFQRQSQGLGMSALWEVASEWMRLNLENTQPDVPSGLRHGKKILPFDRYMRVKLRMMCGRDVKTPPEVLEALKQDVQAVRENSFLSLSKENPLSKVLSDLQAQSLRNVEARQKLKRKRS